MNLKIIQHPKSFQKGNAGEIEKLLDEIACHCQDEDFRQLYENYASEVRAIIKRRKICLPDLNKQHNASNIVALNRRPYFTGDFEIDRLISLMLKFSFLKQLVVRETDELLDAIENNLKKKEA